MTWFVDFKNGKKMQHQGGREIHLGETIAAASYEGRVAWVEQWCWSTEVSKDEKTDSGTNKAYSYNWKFGFVLCTQYRSKPYLNQTLFKANSHFNGFENWKPTSRSFSSHNVLLDVNTSEAWRKWKRGWTNILRQRVPILISRLVHGWSGVCVCYPSRRTANHVRSSDNKSKGFSLRSREGSQRHF